MKIVQFQITRLGDLYILSDEGKLYIHNKWVEIDYPVEVKK